MAKITYFIKDGGDDDHPEILARVIQESESTSAYDKALLVARDIFDPVPDVIEVTGETKDAQDHDS
jgi:hypothetical protein